MIKNIDSVTYNNSYLEKFLIISKLLIKKNLLVGSFSTRKLITGINRTMPVVSNKAPKIIRKINDKIT